jgi:hypothetical protein
MKGDAMAAIHELLEVAGPHFEPAFSGPDEIVCRSCYAAVRANPGDTSTADDVPHAEDCAWVKARRALTQEASPGVTDAERIYPCDNCGTMRTKAEGGTVFTVCDECWTKLYPPKAVGVQAGEGGLEALLVDSERVLMQTIREYGRRPRVEQHDGAVIADNTLGIGDLTIGDLRRAAFALEHARKVRTALATPRATEAAPSPDATWPDDALALADKIVRETEHMDDPREAIAALLIADQVMSARAAALRRGVQPSQPPAGTRIDLRRLASEVFDEAKGSFGTIDGVQDIIERHLHGGAASEGMSE